MKQDLTDVLRAWPYDPEEPMSNFRRVRAEDGRLLIQVREPMGIQQMEYSGRPDGLKVHGKETWLDFFKESAESDPFFSLDHDQCLQLMQEGILFYQRYLVLYQMEDWRGVVRDTDRNIEYFHFIKQHAENKEDWLTVAQYQPYILRMNAIAKAQILWEGAEYDAALALLQRTQHEIQSLEPVESPVFKMEMEKANKHLRQMIQQFEEKRPETELERLTREKQEAIMREDFETAARLRDRIRQLEGGAVKN